jgi:hypothetical protein
MVLGSFSGNASTATALAADPANCSAGYFAIGINASGAAECVESGITDPEVLVMLLDKDTAIAVGDVIANVQMPIPTEFAGKNLSNASRMYIAPTGTASTSGVVTFNIVRHRGGAAVDMTSAVLSIAQDGFVSGAPTIDTSNDDFADGDFFSISCEAAGTGAKGPLWVRVVAE